MRSLIILLALLAIATQRKTDIACQTVKCSSGFRCQIGKCIPQQKHPVKNLCMNHELAKCIKPVKCTKRSTVCTGAKNMLTCGFTATGQKLDFTDDCSPCADNSVDFYYNLPCVDAPLVCAENEDCINGKCFELFNQDDDRNRKICNLSSDCQPLIQICVANKCVEKRELFSKFGKNKMAYS